MNVNIEQNGIEAWRAFLEVHAAVIRVLEREMAEEQGLPLTWYDILAHLDRAPQGRLRMQALAECLLLSRSGVTRLIDHMEQAGLVRRESCPDDRRGSYAIITQEGKGVLQRATPGHLRGIQRHFLHHLNDQDIGALQLALSKVLRGENGAKTRPSSLSRGFQSCQPCRQDEP
jgi:DNA-binding MarR family transcriptional regulator